MGTIVLRINPEKPENSILTIASSMLKFGEVIVFPTDTVYGLGANPFNEMSVLKVYEIKGREFNKPLPILVSDINTALKLGVFDERALKLARKFWPGSLTIVVRRKMGIASLALGGQDKIALRMPNHNVALKLAESLGGAIVGTSANISGFKAAKTAGEAKKMLENRVRLILDAGLSPKKIPSTIVDVTVKPFKIIRLGPVSIEEIEEVIGE